MKRLVLKWKGRKKYDSFKEMPTLLIVFFAFSGSLVSGFYGYILKKVTPEYFEIANRTPLDQWGLHGWLVTVILAALFFIVWHFGNIAWSCTGILRNKYYK